jgi:Complex 1 protein (LYR family)
MSILTRNVEALRLYRDILRASRLFHWPNERGEPWSRVLRTNARKEFEQARFERDPELCARLLVVGRDSLNQTIDRYNASVAKMRDDIDKTRR